MRLVIVLGSLVIVCLIAVVAVVIVLRRTGRGAPGRPGGRDALGAMVLVPVVRPLSATHLVRVAGAIAAADHGAVVPFTVRAPGADDEAVRASEVLIQQAEVVLLDAGLESEGAVRVAGSVADGVHNLVIEREASLVIVGWPATGRDEGTIGEPAAEILTGLPAPVLVARLDGHHWERIEVSGHVRSNSTAETVSLHLAIEVARRLAASLDAPRFASYWTSDATVPEVTVETDAGDQGADAGGPIGRAETLTIVPVAPNLDALADVTARLREEVDVILALPHGPGAGLRRELLPAAERLYTEMRTSSPSGGGQR